MRDPSTTTTGPSLALRGDLAWVHVSGILHMVELGELSGWLHLPDGIVALRDGRIAEALMGDAEGLDAMVQVIGLERGEFRLELGQPERGARLPISPTLVRCGQVLDDWWRLSGAVIEVDDALRARHPVLARLDGDRTLADALLGLSVGFVEAVEAVADALEGGEAWIVPSDAHDDGPDLFGELPLDDLVLVAGD